MSSQLLSRLRLISCAGLGPILIRRLEDAFGSASAVCEASESQFLQVQGIGPKTAQTAQGLGLPVHLVAAKQTVSGLIEALVTYYDK